MVLVESRSGQAGLCFLGISLTAALGRVSANGRLGGLLFGIGSETMLVAASAALGIWFGRNVVGLAMAVNLSIGRMGSYAADLSPVWAGNLYDQGWQGPMILAAMLTGMSFLCALVFKQVDKPRHLGLVTRRLQSRQQSPKKSRLRDIFPVSIVPSGTSRFSMSCSIRSSSRFAALSRSSIFRMRTGKASSRPPPSIATFFWLPYFLTPLFGWTADRYGHRGKQMIVGSLLLPLSFLGFDVGGVGSVDDNRILLGISFSLIPAILMAVRREVG